ncbi:MAG: protein kinase, partial [Planctomycetales bacterium]|nr:protein kinase [Planctomycetales bacterium]
MSSSGDNPDQLPLEALSVIDDLCLEFEDAWRAGQRPLVPSYLGRCGSSQRAMVFRELIILDIDYRRRAGETPQATDYAGMLPDAASLIEEAFATALLATSQSRPAAAPSASPREPMRERELPGEVGRYQVIEKLRSGGCGTVYKGYDSQLERCVAIKVPKLQRREADRDADSYLEEARLIARLNHPHIVPVHDVGRLPDGAIYIVSKYMEGGDLSARVRRQRMNVADAVKVVADIADALEHAHAKGVVHRDVKLSNILIDADQNVALADFGLALPGLAEMVGLIGTPIAMSPEQARGESHLIDRRTDIYSLGVVLYELLTGGRPFSGDNIVTLLDAIKHEEPPRPRDIDPRVPHELERICLRALSKRASDRYATAAEMAEELRRFDVTGANSTLASDVTLANANAGHESPRVVPQGIRSYDQADASFFLSMIPGPRGADGLPQSVRSWKARIETDRSGEAFRVGLLYGPSGAGKTSFIKAGVLPLLSPTLCPVYVEVKPLGTEQELLHRLHEKLPDLPRGVDLVTSFQWMREQHAAGSQRFVIILDQFEQWLHVHAASEETELGLALRQCDGSALQTLLMVRDDFWMPVTRFMQQLEIPLREGWNSAAVDLFDEHHAVQVLGMLGRAYGRLPEAESAWSKRQTRFLSEAVSSLRQDGRIVPLYLSLFAEMIKSRPWDPKTLQQVGGPEGLGVTFLEETFSSGRRSPAHRVHHRSAQAVLRHLLPGRGTNLRGGACVLSQLQTAAGYEDQPQKFAELIEILDRELHLISPVEVERVELPMTQTSWAADNLREAGRLSASNPVKALADGTRDSASRPNEPAYQLTHDFLVPSIREWVAREQAGTRAGRAERRLSDLVDVWRYRKESKYLPSFREWLRIRTLTNSRYWKDDEREMMSTATRHHVTHLSMMATALLVIVALVVNGLARSEATARVNALLAAEPGEAWQKIDSLKRLRHWALPLLQQHAAEASLGDRNRTRATMGLLAYDTRYVDEALSELLHAEPREFKFICDRLAHYREQILPRLRQLAAPDSSASNDEQLRAISAMALYGATDEQLTVLAPQIAAMLVQQHPSTTAYWFDALRPLQHHLKAPLRQRVTDRSNSQAALVATSALADLCRLSTAELVELVPEMNVEQLRVLLPSLLASADE